MAVTERAAADGTGSGQKFAVVIIEVTERLRQNNGGIAIRWTPARAGVGGDEMADVYAEQRSEVERVAASMRPV